MNIPFKILFPSYFKYGSAGMLSLNPLLRENFTFLGKLGSRLYMPPTNEKQFHYESFRTAASTVMQATYRKL